MKIDGKAIANKIYTQLEERVEKLQTHNITPYLAVILVGNDPASEAYVGQKKKRGEDIGCKVDVIIFPESVTQNQLISKVKELNKNKYVHGIIVQRPLPKAIDEEAIDESTDPEKDIDGFLPDAPFPVPIAAAVEQILIEIFKVDAEIPGHTAELDDLRKIKTNPLSLNISDYANVDHFVENEFKPWLLTKKIVVLGKGKTGGGPIINYFEKMGASPEIIDSKTQNPKAIAKEADIIVSAVGKPHAITTDMVKKGVILISVGMSREENSKLEADYDENEIKDIAGYYTPVPGGVGPVNVAMLLHNLILSSEKL